MTKERFFIAVLALGLVLSPGKPAAEEEPGPEIISDQYLEELNGGLKLDGKQYKGISSILDDARPKIKKKWDEVRKFQKKMRRLQGELRKSVRETNEKIREKLTYEQRDRFDAMRLRRQGGERKRRPRFRGIDVDPGDLPPGMLERIEQRGTRRFPPEKWEEPRDFERSDELPPELREHIEKRLMNRRKMRKGSQRDVPPAEEWIDQDGSEIEISEEKPKKEDD